MIYGLVGHHLSHSFSKEFFSSFFKKNGFPHHYENFDLETINDFDNLLKTNDLAGLSITAPYKEAVIPYLDALSDVAQEIGAVNVISFSEVSGKRFLTGHNTDFVGFDSLLQHVEDLDNVERAVIFGSGGASKAVQYALSLRHIKFDIVSRAPQNDALSYSELKQTGLSRYNILINATPLGMFPDINSCVDIPFETIKPQSTAIDLIYNPEKTLFLKRCEQKNIPIINGKEMLIKQAEEALKIFHLNK